MSIHCIPGTGGVTRGKNEAGRDVGVKGLGHGRALV